MRSDGLWKGRSGGIGYAARDMARQVKWEDPASTRTRERERERGHARVGDARVRKKRKSDESDNAVEGSEEYFDESEHVDGFAAEERSSDGEEVDESEEDGLGPEGSDFAAEEGYEEGGPGAEEGYEEVWDEVQETLSTMGHERWDETAEADLCARSQASRLFSASSQASVRS